MQICYCEAFSWLDEQNKTYLFCYKKNYGTFISKTFLLRGTTKSFNIRMERSDNVIEGDYFAVKLSMKVSNKINVILRTK